MDPDPSSLIAEIGATLAGFAAIAGVIRSDPVDRDAAFDIAAYGAMATIFALAAILLADGKGGILGLPYLAAALAVISLLSVVRNVALLLRIQAEQKEANAEQEPIAAVAMGVTAMPLMGLIPILSICAALDVPEGGAARLYAFALGACIGVALALLLYLLAKHFVYRQNTIA